jgi:peptide/nickel transport system substrate-binding protein
LHDPELDSLMDRARRAHEPAELGRLYSDVQRRLIELVPTVPLFDYQVLSAYRRDVRGILFDTSCNRISFTTAWLDRGGA